MAEYAERASKSAVGPEPGARGESLSLSLSLSVSLSVSLFISLYLSLSLSLCVSVTLTHSAQSICPLHAHTYTLKTRTTNQPTSSVPSSVRSRGLHHDSLGLCARAPVGKRRRRRKKRRKRRRTRRRRRRRREGRRRRGRWIQCWDICGSQMVCGEVPRL